jgi:hypothetical protein
MSKREYECICQRCGNRFKAGAKHAQHCNECKHARRIETSHEYYLAHRGRARNTERRHKARSKLLESRQDAALGLKPMIAPDKANQIATQVLQAARKKPAGCSDVRWRIELRRRKMRRRLGDVYMDMLPNP